jgi:Uri superfamily endonuclease
MKELNAYCRLCHVNVHGLVSEISVLDSGNYLYVGDCPKCSYEIRRIVPKNKHIEYPDSWYRHTPKGVDIKYGS